MRRRSPAPTNGTRDTSETTDFGDALEHHRREILVHCYRMTASLSDAEDLTQETFLRAWRSRDEFDGRASVRTWLYRIATNACLDFLQRHERRSRPVGSLADTLELEAAVQPFPDGFLAGSARPADPADAVVQSETTGLLLVAALLRLPPRQRAAAIARDLLGFSVQETAALLHGTPTSVNSLVQRARATMREERTALHSTEPDPEASAIVARYVDAHHRADVGGLLALVATDISITMPPEDPCHGIDQAHTFFSHVVGERGLGRWKLVLTRANGAPATANYLLGPGDTVFRALSIDVLGIRRGQIQTIACFLDHGLFASFGLPLTQPA